MFQAIDGIAIYSPHWLQPILQASRHPSDRGFATRYSSALLHVSINGYDNRAC